MKAIVLTHSGTAEVLHLQHIPDPEPAPGQARVRLKAAGLNHRDLYQRLGYAGPGPMILGSDGAGVVDAVGDPAYDYLLGRNVVINPGLYWGDREEAQGPRFQILGNPTPGTYAEAVVVPVENLLEKPEHLDWVQTAALPLAGLTAWRALFTQGLLRQGQTVLLPGIGSGVSGLALLLAKRAGARVLVTSSSPDKLKTAQAQGADHGVLYTDPHWEDTVRGLAGPEGIDLAVDHSGEKSVPAMTRLVRPGGRVVFMGATTGVDLKLSLRDLYFRQVHLIGTLMGSPREFQDLFRFVRMHRITPQVHHIFPLEKTAEAHRLMESG
ncbi:MAG: zinc-binding dehydrogenase, partial [Deltaproteobacteria bacterium]|nr:zinc-binding dehydrogenase [Deltaproteobacteria bacterium]